MVVIGYALAIIMGLTLGLIGAGGSILTVPILVYLLGVKPVVATGYSLLVVGSAALTGAIMYRRNNLVNLKAAFIFAIPAMITVLIMRGYIVPNTPELVFGINKDAFIMLIFAALMIIVAVFMLKPPRIKPAGQTKMDFTRMTKLVLGSACVGLLTGMVGAGGGFLIIPALIGLFGLHMKEAIGTSLAVIAINSLVGFNGDIAAGISIDWYLLSTFLILTLFGIWTGTKLGKNIDGQKLKTLFAIFTLVIGVAVLAKEIFTILT